jgi:hypothetical protein
MRVIATTGPTTTPAINAVLMPPEDWSEAARGVAVGAMLEGWSGAEVEETIAVGVVPGDSLKTTEVTAVGVVTVGVLVFSVVEVLDSVTTDVTV